MQLKIVSRIACGRIQHEVPGKIKPARIEVSSRQNKSLTLQEAASSINHERGDPVLLPIPKEGA
jgi:hypothetical protein